MVRILLRMRCRDLRQIVMVRYPFTGMLPSIQLLMILDLRIVPPNIFIKYRSIFHRLSATFKVFVMFHIPVVTPTNNGITRSCARLGISRPTSAINPTLIADAHFKDKPIQCYSSPPWKLPSQRNITCLFCIAAHPSLKLSKLSFNLQNVLQKEVNEILSPEAAEAAYRNGMWTNQIQMFAKNGCSNASPLFSFFARLASGLIASSACEDHASVIGREVNNPAYSSSSATLTLCVGRFIEPPVTYAIPRRYKRTSDVQFEVEKCIDAGAVTRE
ncbi:hypothetical protein HA466_0261840 [Hirschfeldia incana]|nr:hypothetical protein HA466_0261840 [Hirschfeldia incana]